MFNIVSPKKKTSESLVPQKQQRQVLQPGNSGRSFQGAHQVRHRGVHRGLEIQLGRLGRDGAVEAVDLTGTTRQEVLGTTWGSPEMMGKWGNDGWVYSMEISELKLEIEKSWKIQRSATWQGCCFEVGVCFEWANPSRTSSGFDF